MISTQAYYPPLDKDQQIANERIDNQEQQILYLKNSELKNQINKLYDGVSDKMILYNNVINEIDYTKLDKKNYFDISINNEIILIKELKQFIKYCDIIDNTQKCTNCLGIKTSLIFFASFISLFVLQ